MENAVTRKQLLDTWGLDANVRDTGGDINHIGTGAGQGPGLASGVTPQTPPALEAKWIRLLFKKVKPFY